MRLILPWLLLGLCATAAAQPLSREQIAAAGKAARARLPPVDAEAARACQATHGAALPAGAPAHTAAALAAAATCFRIAGSLGVAIRLWTALAAEFRASREAVEAVRQLGGAHEAAGSFAEAAQWQARYAQLYPAQADARDRLVRALCTWRQLGVADQARAAEQLLQRNYRKRVDLSQVCEGIRPVQ